MALPWQENDMRDMEQLHKVAYKEINFKSKLIEWCQKNKVKLDFKLLEQIASLGVYPCSQ